MEHSHRGKAFTAVLLQTIADCRALAKIPDDYDILFLTGGASTQFFMIPANFLSKDQTADYLMTERGPRRRSATPSGMAMCMWPVRARTKTVRTSRRNNLESVAGVRALHVEQHDFRHAVQDRTDAAGWRATVLRCLQRYLQPSD